MSDEYPNSWKEIQSRLRQDRNSPEPTPTKHKGFRRRFVHTGSEAAVMASVSPKLLNDKWNDKTSVAWQRDQPWTKCVPVTPSCHTPRLPPPKPDQAIGWTSKTFDKVLRGCVIKIYPHKWPEESKVLYVT